MHSALGSLPAAEFIQPTARFARLFEIEQARVLHDVATLTARLNRGAICCVYSGPDIGDGDALALRDAVDRFCGNRTNHLLAVTPPRAKTDTPHAMAAIGERCWRGTVGWLAPFDQSDHADYPAWHTLLSQWRALLNEGKTLISR